MNDYYDPDRWRNAPPAPQPEMYDDRYLSRPEHVPDFDYKACLDALIKENTDDKPVDVTKWFLKVYFSAYHNEEKVLKVVLTNGGKKKGNCYCDSGFCYCFKDTLRRRVFNKSLIDNQLKPCWESNPLYKKGQWVSYDGSVRGNGLYSLIKTIKKCSDAEVFESVADSLGVTLLNTGSPQLKTVDGYSLILDVSVYPSHGYITYDLSLEQLLGPCKGKYCFNTMYGKPSFFMYEWDIKGEKLHLFETLQYDEGTEENTWDYILPLYEYMIINRGFFERKRWVTIFDDISDVNLDKPFFRSDSWAGNIDIAPHLDWSFLNCREVEYVFNIDKEDSVSIGDILIKKFEKIKIPLTLIIKDKSNPKKNKNNIIDVEEFYKRADEDHGLYFGNKKTKDESVTKDKDEPRYLVENLFKNGNVALISANSGIGKSFLALDIAMMLASGESIEPNWNAINPCKFLYIDAEMGQDDIDTRFEMMRVNYSNQEALNRNKKFEHIFEDEKKLDLTKPEDQKWVEDLVGDAKLIVFDPLAKIIPVKSLTNGVEWRKFSDWAKRLAKGRRTVLVVHHETKEEGNIQGTNIIKNDVNLILSLSKPEGYKEEETVFKCRFLKSRDLYGDNKKSLFFKYHTENGKTKRDAVYFDRKSELKTESPKALEDAPCKSENLLTEEEEKWSEVQVVALQLARKKALDTDLKPEKKSIKNNEIMLLLKEARDRNTITNHLNTLIDKNRLFKRGNKYYCVSLKDELPPKADK